MKAVGYLALLLLNTACAQPAVGPSQAMWKEEVQSQNGSRFIVERSQRRGGRHEIGQEVPIAEHRVTFVPPGERDEISWRSEFGLERDKSSLLLIAIDVVKGVPYIAATPAGCIAYNKWDRPNPPYVFFHYVKNNWQRIPLSEFPAEITEANVVVGTQTHEPRLTSFRGTVPADEIRRLNAGSPETLHLRVLMREPIKTAQTATCPVMVYDSKGGWQSPGGPKAPLPIQPGNR